MLASCLSSLRSFKADYCEGLIDCLVLARASCLRVASFLGSSNLVGIQMLSAPCLEQLVVTQCLGLQELRLAEIPLLSTLDLSLLRNLRLLDVSRCDALKHLFLNGCISLGEGDPEAVRLLLESLQRECSAALNENQAIESPLFPLLLAASEEAQTKSDESSADFVHSSSSRRGSSMTRSMSSL